MLPSLPAPVSAFLSAHWHALMVALGVWTVVATVVNRKWPMPAASAPLWKRAAHRVLVDLPSFLAGQNGKTWMGFTLSIPFLNWTTRAAELAEFAEAPVMQPGKRDAGKVHLLVLLALAGGAIAMAGILAGCATCKDMGNATCARKVLTGVDAVDGAAARIGIAVIQKCAADAKALADAGKLADADKAFTKCEQDGTILRISVEETENAVNTASAGVDIGEAAKSKDYTSVLAPVLGAVQALVKAFQDAGYPLPASVTGLIPGVN